MSYDIAAVRQLLLAAFAAKDLRRFCQDRPPFQALCHDFGAGLVLSDMVDEVIEYCQKHLLFEALLSGVREVNKAQYERFAPKGALTLFGSIEAPDARKNVLSLVVLQSEQESIRRQIELINKNLLALGEQIARHGMSPPLILLNERDYAQEQLIELRARLAQINRNITDALGDASGAADV